MVKGRFVDSLEDVRTKYVDSLALYADRRD